MFAHCRSHVRAADYVHPPSLSLSLDVNIHMYQVQVSLMFLSLPALCRFRFEFWRARGSGAGGPRDVRMGPLRTPERLHMRSLEVELERAILELEERRRMLVGADGTIEKLKVRIYMHVRSASRSRARIAAKR